jgi:hypothetical protein
MKRAKTTKGARNARLRVVNATLSLGVECREQIAWLVGRHVTLEGRAAVSGSEAVRDLIGRAYARLRKGTP